MSFCVDGAQSTKLPDLNFPLPSESGQACLVKVRAFLKLMQNIVNEKIFLTIYILYAVYLVPCDISIMIITQ